MGYLLYPYFLVVFWYRDFFLGSVKRSSEVLEYAANLLSVPLLIRTFFKPLKNEYREGLVLFSILMGIVVKATILFIDFVILAILVAIIIALNTLILLLPLLLLKFIVL